MSLFNELKRRNVLRVAAAYAASSWLLIEIAETLFPLFGYGDAPARIVVIMLAVGFIPALIVAWAFELTPDGLKRDSDVDRIQSITPQTGKKLDRAIMVLLALALGVFAFDRFVLEPARDAELSEVARQEGRTEAIVEEYGDKSIAVLPFADMSQDGDHQYLSDGLAEELLNLLAGVEELRVASRTSAFNMRDSGLSVPEMAATLGVAFILEGSVRRFGDQLRVTVQLIEAGSDTHLWSENYDRQFDNIFAIQDEIAANVVEQLKVTMLDEAPVADPIDPKAYDMLLQANYLINSADPNLALDAVRLLEQVLDIEPDHARAWLSLAGVSQRQVTYGQLEEEEGLAKSYAALDRAEELEPDSRRLLQQRGWMAMRWERDLLAAKPYFQKLIARYDDPYKQVGVAGDFLRHTARVDLLLPLHEREVVEDPTVASVHIHIGWCLSMMGRQSDAIEALRTAVALSPNHWQSHEFLTSALLYDGQYEAALESSQNMKVDRRRLGVQSVILLALGRTEEAKRVRAEMEEQSLDLGAWAVEFEVYRGDFDAAFERLMAEADEVYYPGGYLLDQGLVPLHDDPRWAEFVEYIGATPENLAKYDLGIPPPEEWP